MRKSIHNSIYTFESFRLDSARLMLYRDDEAVSLPPKAVETLVALVQRRGEIVTKAHLMDAIWPDTIVEESNLSQYIHLLRKTLGHNAEGQPFIDTLRRRGYRFMGVVSESELDASVANDRTAARFIAGRAGVAQPSIVRDRRYIVYAGALILLAMIGAAAVFFYPRQPVGRSGAMTTIAVLPFLPLVPENRDAALELGMADTLIERLSRSEGGVVVRPLSSVRRFHTDNRDILGAGKELGVDAVLDGSIQRSGDQIRLNVRLVKVLDGSSICSGSYGERVTNIFSLQDSIAEKIAGCLEAKLRANPGAEDRPAAGTSSVSAYQNYMLGRLLSQRLILADTRRAISYYNAAISEDPQYALAYVALADAYRSLPLANDLPPVENFTKAKQAAERAIELDPSLAEAHAVLGFIVFWFDWNWPKAEQHYLDALKLDPNSADAHLFYAHLLSNLAHHDEALQHAQRARELSPIDLRLNALESQFLIHAGRAGEAATRLKQIAELTPNFWMGHYVLADADLELKNYADAAEQSRLAVELVQTSSIAAGVYATALSRKGDRAGAKRILDQLLSRSGELYRSPYAIALIYEALGETGNALDWLERGFAERDPRMVFLKVEPKWGELQKEPRFTQLLSKLHLSDDHAEIEKPNSERQRFVNEVRTELTVTAPAAQVYPRHRDRRYHRTGHLWQADTWRSCAS